MKCPTGKNRKSGSFLDGGNYFVIWLLLFIKKQSDSCRATLYTRYKVLWTQFGGHLPVSLRTFRLRCWSGLSKVCFNLFGEVTFVCEASVKVIHYVPGLETTAPRC